MCPNTHCWQAATSLLELGGGGKYIREAYVLPHSNTLGGGNAPIQLVATPRKTKKKQTQKKKKKTTLFTELVENCLQRQKRAMFVNFKEKLFMVQQDFSTGFVLCRCRMTLVASWGS